MLFLREVVGLKEGVPGAALAIHTFGADPATFHSHLHILATDGLFKDTGTFYVMKDGDLKPLVRSCESPSSLFRAEVFRFLKREGKITNKLINKLFKWRHSGFSFDNGKRIEKDDNEGREAIVQYMMRSVFSTENITYIEKTAKVIYRTGKMHGNHRMKLKSLMCQNTKPKMFLSWTHDLERMHRAKALKNL